jgi:hypothetical protein
MRQKYGEEKICTKADKDIPDLCNKKIQMNKNWRFL